MGSAALKTATQTIFKNNSSKYYTRLDNKTLRIRFDGDPITSKDIWLWALSCQDDWLITKRSIMSRYSIEAKTAQRLITRLIISGYAKRIENRNRKTGRIEGYHYLFFESPVDKICPPVKIVNPVANRADDVKKPVDKICPPVSLYKKKQESPTVSPPTNHPKHPPEPEQKKAPVGAVVAVSEIRKLIPPEIGFRLNDSTIKSLSNIDKGHIQYAAKEAIDSNAKNKPGLFMKLVREKKPPMCEQINSLKPVPIPTNIDGNSNQMKIIVCYNRNTSGCGCSVMTGTQQPGTDCKKYCPYVIKQLKK